MGRFALLNAPLYVDKLSFADLRGGLRLVALLNERLLLCFRFAIAWACSRAICCRSSSILLFLPRSAQFGIELPLLRLKRNDLIAQLGKICRLRSALAAEVDFTFLQKTPLVPTPRVR